MQIELNQRTIDEIAAKVAAIVADKVARKLRAEQPKMVSTKEAAAILNISTDRLRHIAFKYPHIKRGEGRSARLLFVREALYK